MKTAKLFSNDLEALFVRRPNRFLIIANQAQAGGGVKSSPLRPLSTGTLKAKEISCHCPNPGRLIEFFGFRGYDIPGIRLILERRDKDSAAKTECTAVGLYYRDGTTGQELITPLFSSRANKAVELLVLKEIIPGLKEVRGEYTIGNSRFDFFCTGEKGRHHLVEVKACSLIENGVAMFPDAPSERALKHLEELAELSRKGYTCHVLFVIVHSDPAVFIPNLHTDPALAAGLSRLGRAVDPSAGASAAKPVRNKPVLIHAALLRLDRRGRAVLAKPSVPVDLSHGKLAEKDSGNYLVILELPQAVETEVGSLGTIRFKAGWYVYAGSAMKNLRSRIARHQRKVRKQKHWHLDYLTPFAKTPIKVLPILSYRNLECNLARELLALGGKAVADFGSSDCKNKCPAHLCYFSTSPLRNRDFIAMLFRYRHVEALQ